MKSSLVITWTKMYEFVVWKIQACFSLIAQTAIAKAWDWQVNINLWGHWCYAYASSGIILIRLATQYWSVHMGSNTGD